jgi:hypothetical protein
MPDLTSLITRLSEATEGGRELDEAIGIWAGHKPTMRVGHELLGTDREVPRYCPNYSTSVGAALALIARKLPGCWWMIARGKMKVAEPEYGAILYFGEEPIGEGEHDAGPAMAICLALLRALEAQHAD